jgi:hypothetical protein
MDPFRHLVGLLGRGISPAPRPLPTRDNTNTQKRRHTSKPRAGFEPAIPMFERPMTVLALDCAATETGNLSNLRIYWRVGRTPRTGDRPDARPLPTHRTTQHRKTRTLIHALSGIRTQDSSVRAAEDSTCLRPLGHWDGTI